MTCQTIVNKKNSETNEKGQSSKWMREERHVGKFVRAINWLTFHSSLNPHTQNAFIVFNLSFLFRNILYDFHWQHSNHPKLLSFIPVNITKNKMISFLFLAHQAKRRHTSSYSPHFHLSLLLWFYFTKEKKDEESGLR